MDCEEIFTPSQLIELLKTVKIEVIPRPVNMGFIHESGATIDDVIDCIRRLEERHLTEGPVDDYDKTKKGKIYIFHTLFLEKYWVYVKVKVKLDELSNKFIVVISFHKIDY